MERTSKQVGAVACVMALSVSGALGQDTASDEQAIRDLEQQWVDAIEERDAAAIVDLYHEDGRVMPPNAEPALGQDGVRAFWEEFLQLPDLDMSFEPTTVAIAESGDIAYSIGTYQLSYSNDEEPIQDAGKYIDLWQKVDGEWRVVADMFSSNLPPE